MAGWTEDLTREEAEAVLRKYCAGEMETHARRVTGLALQLFDALQPGTPHTDPDESCWNTAPSCMTAVLSSTKKNTISIPAT